MVFRCEATICDSAERQLVQDILTRKGLEVYERGDTLAISYVGFSADLVDMVTRAFPVTADYSMSVCL